ncbi:glycosyl transferase [Rhizocola hellebori]|uniref:Glycosyl transferase n=1 Tax=Rhizocola hellebori TaxID=1392758 RepID=A0A8J3Q849_9ACTN|nr:glycosyl transferase [Rhizocola hellebori]
MVHNRYRSALPSGENTVVEQEIGWLGAAGVEVVPMLRDSDDIPTLPLLDKAMLPIDPIWAPSAQRELAGLIRRHRPDVVHLHNPYPLISPWIVRTAHRLGVPVVQTAHNYRHVCANGLFFRDGRICHDCVGRKLATPALVHRCYRGSATQSAVLAAALAVHRRTWLQVDRYVAPTPAMAAHLRRFGVAAQRITVKPNAVDDPGEPPSDPGQGVLFGGRLTAEKGLSLLLAAWPAELGQLRVAGDGELRARVESHSGVDYLGRLDRDGMRSAIRASAFVVVPSVLEDVHPTLIIEALANGRPVLGTDLGGIADLIGPAGWVVPADVDALRAGLRVAGAQAAGLRAVARERYLASHTPQRCVQGLIEVYRSARRAA